MQLPRHTDGQDDGNFKAPAKLITALTQLPQKRIFIPPTLDEAVLSAAGRHLDKPPQNAFHWLPWMRWVAAAAALVLLTSLVHLVTKSISNPSPESAFAREDVNHDGRVDILDAF